MCKLNIVYGNGSSGKTALINKLTEGKNRLLAQLNSPSYFFSTETFNRIISEVNNGRYKIIVLQEFDEATVKDNIGKLSLLVGCDIYIEIQTDYIDCASLSKISNSNNLEIKFYHTKNKTYDFVNPKHYQSFSIEVIDMMVSIWGAEAVIKHCEMTAFKYRMRIGNKPGQDINTELEKAKWYENKAQELKQHIK